MAGFSFGAPNTTAPTLSFNTTSSTTPGFSFGNTNLNAATTTPGTGFAAAPTTGGFGFGTSGGGLTMGTPVTNQNTALNFKPGGLTAAPAQTLPAFSLGTGSAFGATPPSSGFGSTPIAMGFGSTPNSMGFGSTPASTVQTSNLSFGSTPTQAQPISFGTPAATTTQTLGFGTPTATTQQGLSFGTPATTAQATLTFGSNTTASTAPPPTFGTAIAPLNFSSTQPTTQATGLSFGTPAATTTQNTLSFGLGTPATTPGTAFSLGTAATTPSLSFGTPSAAAKPTLSFGLTTTTTAATPSLFSAPKTTAPTAFSLSVSGAGTGTSLLAPTSTAIPATTTPAPFKGLGGVDTSTTLGAGQKDAKSAKENAVNPEILQTLEPFKNFVKQQKNLGCEVSRAPVKPMHKVTEDTEALNKLLTSVSSALQKNRVVANKLKADTTKCLQLCEMAQRTHDTPLGLQNDNVAPLEFFMALVAKFERDIQALRQEIDNTEKHVNSLSYPAILNPQELTVALRRLHDSFVALSGRLQSAHSAVVAQKERHLGLRRHLLKDGSNVFETMTRVPRAPMSGALPLPGPTPFSSMGGLNMNLMAGQDRQKSVTFSSGPSPLAGWGTQTNLNLTQATSIFQSPGLNVLSSLSSPQPVDNQSFQLGKPPVGNKRGKR